MIKCRRNSELGSEYEGDRLKEGIWGKGIPGKGNYIMVKMYKSLWHI